MHCHADFHTMAAISSTGELEEDAPEADHILAVLAPTLKLLRSDHLLHWQMLGRGLQVLAKGDNVNTCKGVRALLPSHVVKHVTARR